MADADSDASSLPCPQRACSKLRTPLARNNPHMRSKYDEMLFTEMNLAITKLKRLNDDLAGHDETEHI